MTRAEQTPRSSQTEDWLAAFPEFLDARIQDPEWRHFREKALNNFQQQGLPHTKQAGWRKTPLTALDKMGPFSPVSADAHSTPEVGELPQVRPEWPRAVFIDGKLDAARSSLPLSEGGLEVHDLDQVLQEDSAHTSLVARLGELAATETDSLTALSSAFMQGGSVVRIRKNCVIDQPIHLVFLWTEHGRLRCPRVLVTAESGSQACALVEHISQSDHAGLINGVTEIFIEEGAQLDWVTVENLSSSALHVSNLQAQVKEKGRLGLYLLSLSGHFSRNNIGVDLIDPGAHVELNSLFLAGNEQLADHHTEIRHQTPHAQSQQTHKAVLAGNARGVFRGLIEVGPKATKTESSLSSSSLLLSKRAQIDAEPQLKIFTDDVTCSHGSTVGQLDEEALFYLCTRGLGAEQARQLLTRAFVDEVCRKLPTHNLREFVRSLVSARLVELDQISTKGAP